MQGEESHGQKTVSESTTCHETTSTTHFLVPFFHPEYFFLFAIRDPPLCWKIWKYFWMFWDTERKTKTTALYKALFLKKSRKNCQKLANFNKKMYFWLFLGSFSWFFEKRCCVESCGFLCCVQCPKKLNLSYQKQHSDLFLYCSP